MKYVIIGNSAAGIGAIEGIRQNDKDGEITVITNEKFHTYSRPLISYFLLGKVTQEKMKYRDENFYSENKCTLLYAEVTEIDIKKKQVILSDGDQIFYDKLLVATGSTPFVPSFEGLDIVENKFEFSCLDDAIKIDKVLDEKKRVLIIGAGLIGLKCAESILARVSKVTVLDLAPQILSSILDKEGATIVQEHLESKGIDFELSCSVTRFELNTAEPVAQSTLEGKYTAILDCGKSIGFDLLVLAVGVRPNTALLDGLAETERGVLINEKSETSAPDIYAAGDCACAFDISSNQNKNMALLPNAYMQGECAGINMSGGDMNFNKAIPMNAIGFLGLHIITAGNYSGDIYAENEGSDYKRLFYYDNKLNGCILIGNVDKAGIYTSLIKERTPLDVIDFPLICKKPGLMAFTKEDRKAKLEGKEV